MWGEFQEESNPSILVTFADYKGYASNASEIVGGTLTARGADVDVIQVDHVHSLDAYDAVVLGSAIVSGRFHPHLLHFLSKHEGSLGELAVAFFVVSLEMSQTKQTRTCTVPSLLHLIQQTVPGIEPLNIGIFGEMSNYSNYNRMMRLVGRLLGLSPSSGIDYQTVREWSLSLAPQLMKS